jgi:hypothetical protein
MQRFRRVMAVAALAALATGVMATHPASVGAAPPKRQVATSSATGATYTAAYSCAGGQIRFVVQKGATEVVARFRSEPTTGSWLIRRFPSEAGAFQFEPGGNARNDNDDVSVALEDQIDGAATWTPVMQFTVPDCPDYTLGTRSVFTSVTPTRVLDTRPGSAVNYSGPKPGVNAVVQIAASSLPGLPADATAVSVTVTGTEAAGPGFLQAIPTGSADVGASSNVNMPTAGATVANLAVVPLGADRSISVLTSGGAHVIVDVNGYFVAAPVAVAAGRLMTTAQQRMLDTRAESAVAYAGSQPNGSTLTVDLTARASGLPAGANAAVVNITATNSIGAGFVQAAAGGTLVPGTSSVLNLGAAGQTVAGLSIVPLSPTGTIDVFTSYGADLIVDLIGYFTGPTAAVSASGRFVPLSPERVYDTRLDSVLNIGSFWKPTGLAREDNVYLPGMDAVMDAVFVNGTVTENIGPGFVTFGGYNPSKPTSNLNLSGPSTTVANAAIVKTGGLGFNVYTSVRTHALVDLAGYFTK